MTHSRYSFAKAPIGNNNLDQDSAGEEAVQEIIRRTLESININDHRDHDDFPDVGYGTDDSWNVTRRRWARNKGGGDNHSTGTVKVVRRRRRVVNRGKALANLPGVPWPHLESQGDPDTSQDDDDDDDEEMAALAAEQTRQQTVDYFRSKVSQISKEYSVGRSATDAGSVLPSKQLVSQVSPDSVFTFALASRPQLVRRSTTTTTPTAAVADVLTTTPSSRSSVTTQENRSPSPSSSPLRRRGRRRAHNIELDSRLVQHVERARASVISFSTSTSTNTSTNTSNTNSNTIPNHPPFE
jgi:hypothetical protein